MAQVSVRVQLTSQGPRQLRTSSMVVRDLQRRGANIAKAAGPGHIVETQVGSKRARVAVVTDTFEAMWGEVKRRALTAAIDAGRR